MKPAGPAPLWGGGSGLAAGDIAFLPLGSPHTLQGVGPAVVWIVPFVPEEPASGTPAPRDRIPGIWLRSEPRGSPQRRRRPTLHATPTPATTRGHRSGATFENF